jgi:glutamate racemase
MEKKPIGVFDSGVGGLTVLRELRVRMPQEDFLYVADQGHVPYGLRPAEEVRKFGFGITDFLLARKAKLIVVACNSISAVALQVLREAHPETPFVGMEPAVKPAAQKSRSGAIGVLATEATLQGELFAGAVSRFGRGVRVITRTVPGLVERIEAGEIDGPELESALRERLQPLLEEGIDELVLGCTHYPFVAPLLQKIAGSKVAIVDPSPAVARQAELVLAGRGMRSMGGHGSAVAYTSGDAEALSRFIRRTLGGGIPVYSVEWSGSGENLKLAEPCE